MARSTSSRVVRTGARAAAWRASARTERSRACASSPRARLRDRELSVHRGLVGRAVELPRPLREFDGDGLGADEADDGQRLLELAALLFLDDEVVDVGLVADRE